MLPTKYRLKLNQAKRREEFGGERVSNDLLTLVYRDNRAFKSATIISKKVAKRSVDRNRIRRTISEALIGYAEAINKEILVIVKKNISALKTQEVKGIIAQLLDKAK